MWSKNRTSCLIKVSFSLFLNLIEFGSLNYYKQVKTNKDLEDTAMWNTVTVS